MKRIGGSDIAKLMGLSKYGGPLEVYRRIVDGIEDDWSAPMLRGAAVEPILRAHGQRMFGLELEDLASDYVESPEHEFAHAQVDDLARWQGAPVVAEYKSQSQWSRGWLHGADGDVIPESYAAQVAWQLMCTERELAAVVVGFGQDTKDGGFELLNVGLYEVQRDREFEAYCLHVAREFWTECVIPRRPPAVKPFGRNKRRAS